MTRNDLGTFVSDFAGNLLAGQGTQIKIDNTTPKILKEFIESLKEVGRSKTKVNYFSNKSPYNIPTKSNQNQPQETHYF